MEDDRFQAGLRRYWDVIAERKPAAAGDLDPDLTALIRRLHASGDVPRPNPAYTRRLREDLMRTAAQPLTLSPPLTSNGRTAPFGLHTLAPSLARPSRWSRARAQFATTALVAVTLVVAVVLVRSPGESLPDDDPAGLPALLVPATPSSPEAPAAGSRETVLATTMPADLVPMAGNLDFVLWHAVLDPGEDAAFEADAVDCCPGPQITHVSAGELTLRVDGPVQLHRGSGLASGTAGASRAEDLAAGSEVLLHPGDTAIYDFARPAEYANHGSDPLHVIGGGLLAGAMAWTPAGMTVLDGNEEYSAPALPPGPVQITLIRAMLPPQGTLPAPPPDSLILEVGAEDDANIGQGADGSLRNIGPQEETFYALVISPAGASTGTPIPPNHERD
jgi:hypothetical protein